ncbi:UDP-N-acetylglucosamine 1-carboxyvinyltransferase [Patescibacteria group bacterium]|nr:UDP-N-acetylglucosamine 1-carboxyvinyltransferase [Patescibacteria group bacterium]
MTEKFSIQGNIPLSGEVEISGYKNSAGAILAATLLTDEECQIDNLPQISDIFDLIEILKQIGVKIEWQGKGKIKIKAENINPEKIPFDLFEKTRVSVLLIGPLVARLGSFKIPHPGGDKIGLRPITAHLEGLKKLGVSVKEEKGFYFFEAPKKITGENIVLNEFSVTATENLMMAASLSKGKTKIEIAAAEPQVQDLGEFLKKMGLKIEGAGTHTIEIEGEKKLSGADFSICPDPWEAGTFLIAFAITKGKGIIKNVRPEHLSMFLEKLKEIGVNFKTGQNEISVLPSSDFKAAKIQALPYPGFPTDLQPQTSVLLTQAEGKSLIHDPLYENRFSHLHELRKMGADIEITDPHRALIFGKKNLIGTKVNGNDIRAGAALILAGLAAKGQTIVTNAHQVDRGYEKIEEKLKKLGAKIERIKE